MLIGCGGEVADGASAANQQDRAIGGMGGMTVVNPVKQVTYEDLVEATGIPLHIPADASDVVYTTIALEPTVAQATFTLGGHEVCLRAVATTELEAQDISGLYYEWETTDTVGIGYCTGTVYLKGDVGYVAWLDVAPGINYNMSLKSGATKERLVELANAVCYQICLTPSPMLPGSVRMPSVKGQTKISGCRELAFTQGKVHGKRRTTAGDAESPFGVAESMQDSRSGSYIAQ